MVILKTWHKEKAGFFYIGPEFRITPVYPTTELSNKAILTEIDTQNSGFAVNLGVDYYLTNRLIIGFNQSPRYDIITTDDIDGSGLGISNIRRGLLLGYHFDVGYKFKAFNKGSLRFGVGLSLLNRNSSFNFTEPLFDQNGQELGTATSKIDCKYSANKLFFGYINKRTKISLGIYLTRNSGYFNDTITFIGPFLNYNYNFASAK